MEKVKEKVSEIESALGDYLYYDREELLRQNAYDIGVEKRNKEIIKIMMDNNLSIEKIAKYTGLSEYDIKNLIEQN